MTRVERLGSLVRDAPATQSTALVVRHSIREDLQGADLDHAIQQPLSTVGRELARFLGERLPVDRTYGVTSSPVPRCVETGELIEEVLRQRGAITRNHGTAAFLLGLFVHRPAAMIERFVAYGPHDFGRAWFSGAISEEIILPPAEAGRHVFEQITSFKHAESAPQCDLFVSHDLVLFALLTYLRGVRGAPRWPGFLDGVHLAYANGDVTWQHGEDGGRLPLAPAP